MAKREFDPLDVFLLLEPGMRRSVVTPHQGLQFQPSVDMYETVEALIVRMELAGIQADRLNITLSADDRILSVAGERREPSEDHRDSIRCYQLEVFFGAFERQVVLPPNVAFDRENITANYRDGFLVITLPKRTPRNEKRRIQISE